MSRLTDLERIGLQQDFEELLSDVGRVHRVDSPAELLEGEAFSAEDASTIYEGPMSVTPIVSRRDRFDEFGEGLIYQVQYRVLLPFTATGIQITDRLIMLESDDPEMLLRDFEVRDVHRVSEIAQRRLTVHDIER